MTVVLEASLGDDSNCYRVESSRRSYFILKRSNLQKLSYIEKVGR